MADKMYRPNPNGMPDSVAKKMYGSTSSSSSKKMDGNHSTIAGSAYVTTPAKTPKPDNTGSTKRVAASTTAVSAPVMAAAPATDNYSAFLSLYQAQQNQAAAQAAAALAAQKAAARAAYDRGMNYLNTAYDNQMGLLKENYNSTKNQLGNAFNKSSGDVRRDAAGSLRQAYINKVMNEHNLGQQMAAQGLSGGATESTMANMSNTYGNSRNNIENTKARNLEDLNEVYNNNLAQALQQYNNAKAEAEQNKMAQAMALENALANNEISASNNYQNALSSGNASYMNNLNGLISDMMKYQYQATQANNKTKAVDVKQSAPAQVTTPNNVDLSALSGLQGVTNSNVNSNVVNDYLAKLLEALAVR